MTPEQFLLLADPLPEPTLLVSSDGLIVAGNQAVEDRLGMDLSWLRSRQLLAEVVTESADEVAHYLRLCSRSRSLVIGGMTLHKKCGEEVACRLEGAVVRPKVDGAAAILMLRMIPKDARTTQFVALNQQDRGTCDGKCSEESVPKRKPASGRNGCKSRCTASGMASSAPMPKDV